MARFAPFRLRGFIRWRRWFLLGVLAWMGLGLGWGWSVGLSQGPQGGGDSGWAIAQPPPDPYTTVDFVPQRYQLGQTLYRQNCATCHIGVPPQVLPSEAWRNLIQDSSHYGVTITPPQGPAQGLIWAYLRTFSRLKSIQEERTPYRLQQARAFKALHPQVELPRPLGLESCATCHPAAAQFNFRQLTPPWLEAP